MRKKIIIGILLFTPLAFPAGWTGSLVDAVCKENKPKEACPIEKGTTRFGIQRRGFLKGKYFALDDTGNTKVQAALADYQKRTGRFPEGKNLEVWFTGKPDGNKLALNEFEIRDQAQSADRSQ